MVDIAGNKSTTKAIQVGDEYVGSFESLGDTDWIKVQLVVGVTYSFNLGAATSTSGSIFDTVLELYDASGSLLAVNDDTGFVSPLNPAIGDQFSGSSYFQFTPTTSATYYLSASSFGGSYTGEYLLSAYAEDLPDSTSTPAQLQLGASTVGQITPGGDNDAYTMTTVPGQYYTVLYGGSFSVDNSTSNFFLAFADLVVTNADGAVIAHNPSPYVQYAHQVTFQATSTTTFFSIGPSSLGPDDFGQYILRVNEGSPLDAMVENILPQPSHLNIYFVGAADVSSTNGIVYAATGWTGDEMASAMTAFDRYADIANLTFSVVDDPALADIFMAVAPMGDVAGLSFPYFSTGIVTIGGDTYAGVEGLAVFDPTIAAWDMGLQPGSLGFLTFLHEIGHLLGLAHPFDAGFSASVLPGVTAAFYDYGDFSLDQAVFTVMSYSPGFKEKDGTLFGQPFGNPGTPMAFDVAAVQNIYGANTTTNAGNNTYVLPETNDIGTYYRTIWDTGGVDTIKVAATNTAGATIDLRAASLQFDSIGGGAVSFVRGVAGGFTVANGVVIENATGGAGDDRLIGNAVANVLTGNGGADRMAGNAGDDSLYGGDGNDVLFGDAMPGEISGIRMGDGQVVKVAGAGNSWFDVAIDLTSEFSLAADSDIANATTIPHITITGTGDGHFDFYALTLTAGTTITLDIDHTTGGLDSNVEIYTVDGSDFFFHGSQDDNLTSAGAGGSSTSLDAFGTFIARTSGTYYIVVEDALNFFVAPGQNYELNISVSATTESIGSGAGDDLLDGGTGADTMSGGGGNDRYIIDNSGDVAIEISGGGDADEVIASVSYSAVGQSIEKITLTGSAAINASGQELNNIITGNSAANRLDGGAGNDWLDGGLGADIMTGGTGNDTFVIDNRHDVVVESSGAGTDEVKSSITYTLGRYVENLTLTGSANINGYGQSLDNRIVGNSGANTLYGDGGNDYLDGGAGADIMIGGDGNDVFVVDNVGDRIVESIGGGRDEVRSSVSFDLGILLDNIEIVTLTGTGNIDASGNCLDNVITGNAGANRISGGLGNDRLDGKGGADHLAGGAGRDAFIFSSALGGRNVDSLMDFSSSHDWIELDNAVFTVLCEGSLSASAFKDIGRHGASVDSNDRIIYNSDTGDLFYDADGSGSASTATLFANLGRHTSLSAGDFIII